VSDLKVDRTVCPYAIRLNRITNAVMSTITPPAAQGPWEVFSP
jgi:hypothetical protein